MKVILGVVVLADQIGSRRRADGVPAALARLQECEAGYQLPFERTAGDEVQAFTTSPEAVLTALSELARLGGWRIGLGLGQVETPLPPTTREARGPAYNAARAAIVRARTSPQSFALEAHLPAPAARRAEQAESALLVTLALLGQRTDNSWQAAELAASEPNQQAIAEKLGITQGAVSRRLRRGHVEQVERGLGLAGQLLAEALGGQG